MLKTCSNVVIFGRQLCIKTEDVWYSGVIAHIHNLDTRWRCMIDFIPQLLYPQGRSPWYQLNRRVDGPQIWPRLFRIEKNLFPCRQQNHSFSLVQVITQSLYFAILSPVWSGWLATNQFFIGQKDLHSILLHSLELKYSENFLSTLVSQSAARTKRTLVVSAI